MDRFLGQAGFNPMSIISPETPTVILPIGNCWVCWIWWQSIESSLHEIQRHSHLCQLGHDRCVGAGKDCIILCQYFHILTLRLHSLENSILIVYRLAMLFWRGWRYTADAFDFRYVPSFACGGDRYTLFMVGLLKKCLERGPFLEVGGS